MVSFELNFLDKFFLSLCDKLGLIGKLDWTWQLAWEANRVAEMAGVTSQWWDILGLHTGCSREQVMYRCTALFLLVVLSVMVCGCIELALWLCRALCCSCEESSDLKKLHKKSDTVKITVNVDQPQSTDCTV